MWRIALVCNPGPRDRYQCSIPRAVVGIANDGDDTIAADHVRLPSYCFRA